MPEIINQLAILQNGLSAEIKIKEKNSSEIIKEINSLSNITPILLVLSALFQAFALFIILLILKEDEV